MKYYQVCIDGIDKSGKDVLCKELDFLCGHSLSINVRGLLSNLAYDIIYKRDHQYDFSTYNNVITVRLSLSEEDWQARCVATKEQDVSLSEFQNHQKAFDAAEQMMVEQNLIVLPYNTSLLTPYMIAKDILTMLEKLNSIE